MSKFNDIENKFKNSNRYMITIDYDDINYLIKRVKHLERTIKENNIRRKIVEKIKLYESAYNLDAPIYGTPEELSIKIALLCELLWEN